MWFFIVLAILGVLAWWLSGTNLWRSKQGDSADSTGRRVGSASARAADDVGRAAQNRSGLRKRPYD